MCEFFSVVSDGKGEVLFFTPEDVVKIMSEGNKENYTFNSHTSICNFKGINSKNEDKWNKWEYSPEKDDLKKDGLVTTDDHLKVKKLLKKWFDGKDVVWLRNLYGMNTGNSNTGDRNTGHWNTGNRNTGNSNTGNGNTGDRNTGNRNTGDRNTGHWNTGDRNTGHWNTGNSNTGDWNTGDRNTGHCNTGHWNTANYSSGFFCTTEDNPRLFNKTCSKESAQKAREFYLPMMLTEWINSSDMTKAEKEAHEFWETTGGYLKFRSYKEAWEICAKSNPEKIQEIQTWENFDREIFKEITGIEVKGIADAMADQWGSLEKK